MSANALCPLPRAVLRRRRVGERVIKANGPLPPLVHDERLTLDEAKRLQRREDLAARHRVRLWWQRQFSARDGLGKPRLKRLALRGQRLLDGARVVHEEGRKRLHVLEKVEDRRQPAREKPGTDAA